jgi:hypothetical protein
MGAGTGIEHSSFAFLGILLLLLLSLLLLLLLLLVLVVVVVVVARTVLWFFALFVFSGP